MDKQQILENFLAGKYEQIFCEKCAMTFLTNVYDFSDTHVLLEKRSYGLEYYCGAIQSEALTKVPKIERIGILTEDDEIVDIPSQEIIYSGEETDLRFIYVMERLKHLDEEDSAYFDRCVKDLEWKNDADRQKIIEGVSKRYDPELAQDIAKLYRFYTKYKDVLAWDLHGDNLMRRIETDEIVILDPYTRNA
jgi:hypothetical protein